MSPFHYLIGLQGTQRAGLLTIFREETKLIQGESYNVKHPLKNTLLQSKTPLPPGKLPCTQGVVHAHICLYAPHQLPGDTQ